MGSSVKKMTATLYAAVEPDESRRVRFIDFLKKKYGGDFDLVWEKSDIFGSGFRLEVGEDIYDWTVEGRFRQLKNALQSARGREGEPLPLIKETVKSWKPNAEAEETGEVLTVGDGIATVKGLQNAAYGEILVFECGVKGMVQNLGRNAIGCVLFDDDSEVLAGSKVFRSGKSAGVPVGDAFLGRVIDALGSPVDGKGEIKADGYRTIERPAPSITDRQPVNRPLETGILAIDSMFPIGRGQRELIIGDRQTGKTAIATDAIINQKGKNVICIYVAIGQKASSVAQLVANLQKRGAMEYTVVMVASASEAAPRLYVAPYAGCALGEYFMEKGKDVLIVYDDLSKHAIAYRSLSLLLGRSPGREAYPGDVFYLHSRLLERSAHLCDRLGGGSMTALPIVETQSGDVSAYIPTNIISITDGQIFLESDLFFAGQRPAVNVGLSVSRVGGAAQTKAVKKASGTLRLDLAQFREIEVFTQFASDLDETTKRQLTYGQCLMRMLRQPQNEPLSSWQEAVVLTACLSHAADGVPLKNLKACLSEFTSYFEAERGDVCARLGADGSLSDEDRKTITDEAHKFFEKYTVK